MNPDARLEAFGQDYNDQSFAVCGSDMMIKGQNIDHIAFGDSFTNDHFAGKQFDYMLANPPFGVEWKPEADFIKREHEEQGFGCRFGAGLPRINDGSLLFLLHMISKMKSPEEGGTRLAIVFNGSPLFTGAAGSGESEIRRWIIENDWLEAIVALPDQLFYNTGIYTYLWIITNRKEPGRKGKIQLVDGTAFFKKMRKSLGNKRHEVCDDQRDDITRLYGALEDGEHVRLFDNEDFGYRRITVERPLRLNFAVDKERIARLQATKAFIRLAFSKKRKNSKAAQAEIAEGLRLQKAILSALDGLAPKGLPAAQGTAQAGVIKNRDEFAGMMKGAFKEVKIKVPAALFKAILIALAERDETADICTDLPAPGLRQAGAKGNPDPDPELRDYENVPLKEDVDEYMKREVLPHVPDLPAAMPCSGEHCIYVLKCADGSFYKGQTNDFPKRLVEHKRGEVSWTSKNLPIKPIHWESFKSREEAVRREKYLKSGKGREWLKKQYDEKKLKSFERQTGAWIDHSKTKIGYEINFNRYFYKYTPPRPLDEIEADLKKIEKDIADMLAYLPAPHSDLSAVQDEA